MRIIIVDFESARIYFIYIMIHGSSPYACDIACFLSAEERYWRTAL